MNAIESESKFKFRNLKFSLISIGFMSMAIILGQAFLWCGLSETNIVIVFILFVLLTARCTKGYVYGIVTAVASIFLYNFFFTEPYFTLAVNNPDYVLTFGVMLITAIITSAMTSKVQKNIKEAKEQEAQARILCMLSNRLTDAKDMDEIVKNSIYLLHEILKCEVGCVCYNESGSLDQTYWTIDQEGALQEEQLEQPNELQARMFQLLKSYDENEQYADWPIYGQQDILGVLRISRLFNQNLTDSQIKLIRAMNENIGMAMDRFRQRQKAERNREKVQQERYRGDLLRAISHDLRTPLSGIMGSAEILMDQLPKEGGNYFLARDIFRDAEWLKGLVENILNLTKLQKGKLIPQMEYEAVEELVENTVSFFSRRFPEYDISIDIPAELILVKVDGQLIMQVLINLLDNARKHASPEEGICIKVEFDEKTSQAIFSVIDYGEGIAEADLPNLFQMFYTSSTRNADARKGIGLGLTICQGIVQAHGGEIWAENRKEGNGAVFRFRLLGIKESKNE